MKADKRLKKLTYLTAIEELTLQDLVYKITTIVEHDDAALFVALFEKSYESWDVTEECIKHFKALEVIYNKELDQEEKDDLSPKSLL